MPLVLDYIDDYLASDKNNVAIIEGMNGSGKSTICSKLMGKYPYFKHLGALAFDGVTYDPVLIKNYRLFDRYKPIQDFVIGMHGIYINVPEGSEIDPMFFQYGVDSIFDFTDKYLLGKNPLFVFLTHHRYLSESARRGRTWITDNYLYWYTQAYTKLAKALSCRYRVLEVTDSTVQLRYGE